MKKINTKKALVASLLSLVLCVSMLVGSTFAWFTDTATTAVNTIQAGSLDVSLEMLGNDGKWTSAEGKTLQFLVEKNIPAEGTTILWEPGCTYELPALRVVNNGNLALKYKVAISGLVGDSKLCEVIDWYCGDTPISKETGMVMGTDTVLNAKTQGDAFTIKGHMQETAGNEYQGLSVSGIAITVYATQATVEKDSNGNQYDADAEYAFVSTESELEAALNAGKDVIFNSALELTKDLEIKGNVTINGNGNALISAKPIKVAADANVAIHNVKFTAPTNAKNNASNFYASGLKGKLIIDGCSFSGTQWDCIQILPVEGAEIVINNCRFEAESEAQRFIHIEASQNSNANVKITLTNNFFGASDYLKNALIDLDYINIDGIDFGGNNVYTDTNGDIYVCGASFDRSIGVADAYKALGAKLLSGEKEEIAAIDGDVTIAAGSDLTFNNKTSIIAGVTISGAGKDKTNLKANNAKIGADDVTIKDITIKGSGSAGTGGTLNINGSNTTIENVDYEGDGNIAITVSTGAKNTGTVFRNTKITNAFRGIQFWSLSGDSLIENCVLDVAGYTFNIDAAVAGSTLTLTDSTLNGWTSYTSGIQLVTFKNCKLGLNAYQYLRPYSETVLEDCEFTSAGYLLNAGGSDAYTITLTNCTKNGTKITAENVKDLLLDMEDWNANVTLIVNGVTVKLF